MKISATSVFVALLSLLLMFLCFLQAFPAKQTWGVCEGSLQAKISPVTDFVSKDDLQRRHLKFASLERQDYEFECYSNPLHAGCKTTPVYTRQCAPDLGSLDIRALVEGRDASLDLYNEKGWKCIYWAKDYV